MVMMVAACNRCVNPPPTPTYSPAKRQMTLESNCRQTTQST